MLLRGFAKEFDVALLNAVEKVVVEAPLRHMVTPGGYTMSVAMTNCGQVGWVTNRSGYLQGRSVCRERTGVRSGYSYDATDPETGNPWPPLPKAFMAVATNAATHAGFEHFVPDACLINCYEPGARLSLHQDKNERDAAAPIVSVSLGLAAVFLFGGLRRSDRPQRYRLEHGDVAVWGGPTRFAFHGILPLADGRHPLLGRRRINLTFRKAL